MGWWMLVIRQWLTDHFVIRERSIDRGGGCVSATNHRFIQLQSKSGIEGQYQGGQHLLGGNIAGWW